MEKKESPDGFAGNISPSDFELILVRDRGFIAKVVAAVGVLLGIVGFRFFAPTEAGLFWLQYAGYWSALACVVFLGWALIRDRGGRWPKVWDSVRGYIAALLIALGFSVLWQVNEPRQFKVLFDEHGYLAISKSMHEDREAVYPMKAHFFMGKQYVLERRVDKRPVLFPFLVSALHDLTGYREANIFVVNGLLGFVSLFLVYPILLRISAPRVAICGQLLWAGLPLLPQSATGAGYDLLNLCLLQGWLLAALTYGLGKGSLRGLDVFVGVSVALALVRSESLIYAVGTAVIVLMRWRKDGVGKLSWLNVLMLFPLLSPVCNNLIFERLERIRETAPGQDFFSVAHVPSNLFNALTFVVNPDRHAMNSALLGWIGLFCLVLFWVNCISKVVARGKRLGEEDKHLLVFTGVVGLAFSVLMCSFWGSWMDPVVSRFSLPVWLLFLVVSARIYWVGKKCAGDAPGWVIVALGLWVWGVSLPASSKAVATTDQPTPRERIFLEEKLAETVPGEILLLVPSPVKSIIDGYAACNVGFANAAPWKIQATLDRRLYKEVWVAEQMSYDFATHQWKAVKEKLTDGFDTELVAEFEGGNGSKLRIRRILGWRDKEEAQRLAEAAFTPAPRTRLEYFKALQQIMP